MAVTTISDDFSTNSGYWAYSGSAYRDVTNEHLVLTDPAAHQVGVAWLNTPITSQFVAEFSYKVCNGTGADGMVFIFYKNSSYTPADGGALGFSDYSLVTGYGVEFDGFANGWSKKNWVVPPANDDPSPNHIAIIKDRADVHLAYVNDTRVNDNQWHQVRVTVQSNSITIRIDGSDIISWTGAIDRTFGAIGFSAATGAITNMHIVDNFWIEYGETEPPNSVPETPATIAVLAAISLLAISVVRSKKIPKIIKSA
jgi:hypothetical protein